MHKVWRGIIVGLKEECGLLIVQEVLAMAAAGDEGFGKDTHIG